MVLTKRVCDHCGKPVDVSKDYTDLQIDIGHQRETADLCKKCFGELYHVVGEYLTTAAKSE